jgi:uncharacterized surface anchored protein
VTTNTEAVAIATQRAKIPTKYAITFEQITNAELASMTRDDYLKAEVKAYAGWELDYREAMEITVYYEANSDQIKRRKGSAPPEKSALPIDRSRWSMKGAEETIKRKMEESK